MDDKKFRELMGYADSMLNHMDDTSERHKRFEKGGAWEPGTPPPQPPESLQPKKKFDVDKLIADTDTLLERMDKSSARGKKLLETLGAESERDQEELDSIYEDIGSRLDALDREEIAASERMNEIFNEEEKLDEEEEKLERAGLPPPIRRR